MVAKWPLEVEIAMGILPVPISVSSGHFALRYEVPKFLARGGHLCMAVLTIIAIQNKGFGRCALPRAAPTSGAESACGLWLRRAQCMNISKMQSVLP